MNALAGGGDLHGWPGRRMPVLRACVMLAACGAAAANGGQFAPQEAEAVVISDELVAPGPTPARIQAPSMAPAATMAPAMPSPAAPTLPSVVAEPEQGIEFDPASEPMPLQPMAGPATVCVPRYCGPRWDVAVDALMLWEGNSQSLPLLLDESDETALNAGDMATLTSAGPRVSLIRVIDECRSIEGNYFQVRPFSASLSASASGSPYSLTNTGDLAFSDIESATATSSGWIQSAELNFRTRHCGSPITWLAGFRWVQLNSLFNLDYTFANPDPFGSGSVDAAAGNDLYGGQIGADALLWSSSGHWCVNGIAKAGLFYNSAYQESTAGFVMTEGDPFPLGKVKASMDQVAFFGEAGLNSTYWIKPWLAWRLGYSVFWAGGVAVAAQQLSVNSFGDDTTEVNATGGVLLHGVTTGFEARW